MTDEENDPPTIDTSVAHPARRYDYWLGGKDNFAADRASGDLVAATFPTIRLTAWENRRFLRRAVTYLTAEAGIRQFLDIGTGIPTANNTHEVAQAIAPESRVVYVDNDPIVLVHARALLSSTREGATAYLDADFRQPEKILGHADLTGILDLSRPVALMLVALLHFIDDDDDPYGHVRRLVQALPSGSHLVISHITTDFMAVATAEASRDLAQTKAPAHFRSQEQVAAFFDGLPLIDPGIVSVANWRADAEVQPRPSPADVSCYGAIAAVP